MPQSKLIFIARCIFGIIIFVSIGMLLISISHGHTHRALAVFGALVISIGVLAWMYWQGKKHDNV